MFGALAVGETCIEGLLDIPDTLANDRDKRLLLNYIHS